MDDVGRVAAVVVCRAELAAAAVGLARLMGFDVVGAGPPWPDVTKSPTVMLVEDELHLPGATPWSHVTTSVRLPVGSLEALIGLSAALRSRRSGDGADALQH
jgi:hypothetical protein